METDGRGHNYVSWCKNTAIKDDGVLHEFNDVVVKGLNLFQLNIIFI